MNRSGYIASTDFQGHSALTSSRKCMQRNFKPWCYTWLKYFSLRSLNQRWNYPGRSVRLINRHYYLWDSLSLKGFLIILYLGQIDSINKFSSYSSEWAERLANRKSKARIGVFQKEFLMEELEKYPDNRWQILFHYNIPPSTYYKLKNDRHSIELAIKKARLNGVSDDSEMTDEEKKYIKFLVTPPRPPLTIKLINEKLSNVFGQRDRAKKIRQFMKSDMRYSFKKGSSRPFKVLSPKSDIMNGIFWWKLLSLICRDALIINIDESSFSRSVKSNYSWLPRGKGSSIIHNTILGRCSLILGIWIDGKIIGSITTQTVKREDFHYFLRRLRGALIASGKFHNRQIWLLMDNASIHTSETTITEWRCLGFRLLFVPPYSPQYAPVENAFGAIKSHIRSSSRFNAINYDKSSGIEWILRAVGSLRKESVRGMLRNLIIEAKKTIKLRCERSRDAPEVGLDDMRVDFHSS